MRSELLEVYERELAYLRSMGAEFGERYPRIASRLLLEPDRCEDPHVERLIESFAFLAARIHLRLNDDLPEISTAMLELIYPHYLRPLPAMSVAECQVDAAQGKQSAAILLPPQTTLVSKRTVEGMPCRFRTVYPVEIWPLVVSEAAWRLPEAIASPVRVQGAAGVLRVLLRGAKDVDLRTLPLRHLRFYFSGEAGVTLTLYELLSRNCLKVLLRDPKQPHKRLIELRPNLLQPCGFEEDEALLPYTRRSFAGFRLLQEYFSFPEKFLFFNLKGLEAAASIASAEELEVLIYVSAFERPERAQQLEVGVSAGTLRLGCTPIVNLFQQAAEPILLTQTQHEYRVIPDVRFQHMMEIFSINEVLATSPSRRSTTPVMPFYAHRFDTVAGQSRVHWHAMRRYTPFDERQPSDMYLSLVDVDGAMTEPGAEVLTVQCSCTNHDLPSRLNFYASDGDFDAEGFGTVSRIRALHRPTASVDPPRGRGQAWRLISQLSLNYLSLSEGGLRALQEILRVHNFSEAAHLENQIASVTALSTRPHFALMQTHLGSMPARGTRVELEVDERQFAPGGAYLFSAVLNRFLASYASLNSFCQLAVTTNLRKGVLGEWRPSSGNRELV